MRGMLSPLAPHQLLRLVQPAASTAMQLGTLPGHVQQFATPHDCTMEKWSIADTTTTMVL